MNIDDKATKEIAKDKIKENEIIDLTIITDFTPYEYPTYCNSLVEKITKCTPCSICLRKIVRASMLPDSVPFDLVAYEDLNFVEVGVTHLYVSLDIHSQMHYAFLFTL